MKLQIIFVLHNNWKHEASIICRSLNLLILPIFGRSQNIKRSTIIWKLYAFEFYEAQILFATFVINKINKIPLFNKALKSSFVKIYKKVFIHINIFFKVFFVLYHELYLLIENKIKNIVELLLPLLS